MMTDLAGKRVLVTGGAIRVGAVIVRAFAEAGAKVVIHCRTSGKEAETLLRELGGEAAGHGIVCCDLSVPGAPEELIRSAGPLDILVCNASTFVRRPFDEETEEDILASLRINALAPVALMKAFAAALDPEKRDAAVVNMADQAVSGPADPSEFGYLASKKMLAEATEAAALQYAPRIRVNAVAPGPSIAPAGLEHLGMRKTLPLIPLKRRTDPEDIAAAVLFCARNTSMTGAVVHVDGGRHLCARHCPQEGRDE